MGILSSINDGLQNAVDATKKWVNRHPALTGAVVGGTAGSVVPVVGTIVGAVAGATIGAHVGRDDDQKPADVVEEKKDA